MVKKYASNTVCCVLLWFKGRVIRDSMYVVSVQFYPWFNFGFPLFFSMLIYDEYQTTEYKN